MLMELVERVKAQLRRYRSYNTPAAAKVNVIEMGRLTLNTETHPCTLDGEELFHQIWGDEYYTKSNNTKSNNTITVHIPWFCLRFRRTLMVPSHIELG